MNDLRVCTKGAGFAVVGALSVVALTLSAFGQGQDTPSTGAPALTAGVPSFGTTAGYTDSTDAVCPYTGSTSPDVFYTYSSAAGGNFSLSLCNSGYDTKVYCIDPNTGTLMATSDGSANGVACNDDFCSSPGGGAFRSFLGCVVQSASGMAIVAVDGFGGALGAYEILVTEQDPLDCLPPGPCIIECPPGSTLEGEGCNFDGSDDNFNGGCNSSPPVFSTITCGETVCGNGWINPDIGLGSRDTDWYQLDATGDDTPTSYTWAGVAEFPFLIGRVDNNCGTIPCGDPNLAFAEAVTAEPCDEATITTPDLANCLLWMWAGPSNFTDVVDCNQPAGGPPNEIGELYSITLTCEAGTPPCPWDLDGDQIVGFGDLLKILSFWGPCPTG